jgi:hypothetical protein
MKLKITGRYFKAVGLKKCLREQTRAWMDSRSQA